jgi:hypothetical protein
MRGRFLPLLAVLVVAPSGSRAADDLSAQVSIDRARPAADELVRLTYTFSGSGLGGALRLPQNLPLRNLTVAGGPSKSEQISFVNGVLSRSLSLTWYLKPQGPGPAEVGEVSFGFDDKVVKAASYLLEVGPARGRSAPQPGDEDPIAQFLRPQQRRPGAGAQAPFLEFRVTADKTTAYVGEEVTLHYELLTQADVQGLEYLEPPRFPGCWAEDLEKPEKPEGHRDVVDGKTVMRFTLLKKLVSGLNPGTVILPEAKIRTSVRATPDPFGDPFGGFFPRPQVVDLVAKPVTLRILPIPGEAGFHGPVGHFDLTAKLDRPRVAVGEAVTLRIRLSGTGNLRTATDSPKLEVPRVTLYPPSVKADPGRAGHAQVATEWSYVLVPKESGSVTIPPVSLATFDPAEKRIVTRSTLPLTFVAEGGALASAGSLTTAETTLPNVARTDVPAPPSRSDAGPLAGAGVDLARQTVTLPLWAAAGVPVAALFTLGVVLALRRRTARAAWRQALVPEPAETKERAAARVDRAMHEALARRYLVSETAPAADILSTLAELGAPAPEIDGVKMLLSDVDFLRFAPQLGDYGAKIAELRQSAARVLPRLS